ncbi:MAG: hypothetical protein IAE79_16780, partial [Anaerolinea sp.]|nr:hypothetical protein [Anaerolinea sp.]
MIGIRAKWVIALLLACFLVARQPSSAAAHPADMYTQTYTVRLSPTAVTLTWTISPGPLLAPSVWYAADADGDNVISDEEARAWLSPLLADWQSALDATPLTWEVTAVTWPTDRTAFELGDDVISALLSATFPAPLAAADLHIANPYAESVSINWFYLYGADGIRFARPQQQNGRLTIPITPDDEAALTYWDSGTPALAAGAAPVTAVNSEEGATACLLYTS